jgi:putative transposase
MSVDTRRAAVGPGHAALTIVRQCELLGLARASWYYRPASRFSPQVERLLRAIDEQYTATPFYGSRRMAAALRRQGHALGRRRARRLMRLLGLEAIYPKPSLSRPSKQDVKYPYLLRGVEVVRVGQVWSTDITYIRMRRGWVYLAAVIDWHSRRVLSWRLSLTLEADFCLAALDEALENFGRPEIFNTDQGSQFTGEAFTARLLAAGVRISRDGRGRALDNVFVERLWRSLKTEEVYLKDYAGVGEATAAIGAWFEFYNHRRPHQGLDYRTPHEVFADAAGTRTPMRVGENAGEKGAFRPLLPHTPSTP